LAVGDRKFEEPGLLEIRVEEESGSEEWVDEPRPLTPEEEKWAHEAIDEYLGWLKENQDAMGKER
jgi:hypothetical protein